MLSLNAIVVILLLIPSQHSTGSSTARFRMWCWCCYDTTKCSLSLYLRGVTECGNNTMVIIAILYQNAILCFSPIKQLVAITSATVPTLKWQQYSRKVVKRLLHADQNWKRRRNIHMYCAYLFGSEGKCAYSSNFNCFHCDKTYL